MFISSKQLGLIVAGSAAFGAMVGVAFSSSSACETSRFNIKSHWPYTGNSELCGIDQQHGNSIYVVNTVHDFQDVLPLLMQDLDQIKLLGFDCEWTSSQKGCSPVSLLQVATISGLCILLRLCHYKGNLPQQFLDILRDKGILKVGVGCFDDSRKLLTHHDIVVNGCVDLRDLAIRDRQCNSLGLKSLALTYLNISMDKSKSVQCSNWNNETLTNAQISYAANDALIAVKIFSSIMSKKIQEHPSILDANISKAMTAALWNIACTYCQGFKDTKFKDLKGKKGSSKSKAQMKNGFTYKTSSYSARKLPLYDNCKLQAPDGQLLSTCDKKKASWYIEKKLADVVAEEPFTVRLRFEPSGRPSSDRDYYLQDKDNICVVCGVDGPIVRKNVVPHEYRRHFPLALKDHISHDILPLCVPCHRMAGRSDDRLRNELAIEYDAPLGSIQAVQLLEDQDRRSVRSAGRALFNNGSKIPPNRKEELERIIKEFYETDNLTDDLILEASQLQTRYKNEAYVCHGDKVANTIYSIHEIQGLVEFEKRWRQHFLDTMHPEHLPHLWSVEHNHYKLFERNLIEK